MPARAGREIASYIKRGRGHKRDAFNQAISAS
jgi:hypothetical protein